MRTERDVRENPVAGHTFLTEQELAAWPNCSVPDCDAKAYLPLSRCWPHLTPEERRTPPQYIRDYLAHIAQPGGEA